MHATNYFFMHEEALSGGYIEDEVIRGHTPCRDYDAPPDRYLCGLMGFQEAPMPDYMWRTVKGRKSDDVPISSVL
jgi:hypothetical protein